MEIGETGFRFQAAGRFLIFLLFPQVHNGGDPVFQQPGYFLVRQGFGAVAPDKTQISGGQGSGV